MTGGLGRGAEQGRQGGVGQVWTLIELFAEETRVPRGVQSIAALFPEGRTSEILFKPMEEHNDYLTSGW